MTTNKEASKCLRRAYNNLARSIEAVADLECVFSDQKDKRVKIATATANLIMRAQTLLNPLIEDEDIKIY